MLLQQHVTVLVWMGKFARRNQDPFVVEVRQMLSQSKLPTYLRNLYSDVLATKTGQLDRLEGEALLKHIKVCLAPQPQSLGRKF